MAANNPQIISSKHVFQREAENLILAMPWLYTQSFVKLVSAEPKEAVLLWDGKMNVAVKWKYVSFNKVNHIELIVLLLSDTLFSFSLFALVFWGYRVLPCSSSWPHIYNLASVFWVLGLQECPYFKLFSFFSTCKILSLRSHQLLNVLPGIKWPLPWHSSFLSGLMNAFFPTIILKQPWTTLDVASMNLRSIFSRAWSVLAKTCRVKHLLLGSYHTQHFSMTKPLVTSP
jgi:hypothetical protein